FEADSSILDVKGGESVEFAVAGEKVSVRIHDTRLQKRLEVRRRQVAMLLQALSSVAGAPQLSPEERVAILSRASMMNNALIISKSSELYPAERVAVLESYLYLVNEPNLTRANGAASRYGANWVFIEEINAVRHAIDVEAKEVIRSAILGMAKDVTIGMVEFVADRSGVGGIYTAVTGRTVMGQRVNVLNRILAAAGALNNIKQMTASTQWGLDRKANEWMAKADAERVAWRKAEAEKRAAADIVVEGPSSPGFPGGKPPVVPPPGPAPRVSNQSAPGSWPASNTASERLAERLRLAGVEERAADRAAADLLRRNPSVPPAVAEAGLAADAGVPASVVMERAKITADTYASRLDDYYKSVLGIDDPNVRARMTRRAMGDLTPANVRAAAAVADEASGGFASAPSSTTTVFPKAEVPGSNIITPPGGKAVDGAAKSASSSSITVVPGRPSPVPVPPRTGSSTTELPAPGIPGSGVASEADHTGDYRFADRIANGLWDPTENGNTSLIGARQPHTGPGYMDRLLQADAEVARVAARSKGESLAAVEATIQRETLRLQELHRSAQVIEDVVGSRRQIDYAQLRLFRNKGCGEQEALVGQFYMNHSAVTPSRAMAALGMDRTTFERTLDQFLSRTQAVTDPQDRANRIKEYLAGQ
ncbi:MAG TPA: hypothetical protein VK968_14935, partial [Roseimicrobium sp.]|nr:hypothetical protein [Roseimicrobium sp.]